MTAIPKPIVNARRVAGMILLLTTLLTVAAAAIPAALYANREVPVAPLTNSGGSRAAGAGVVTTVEPAAVSPDPSTQAPPAITTTTTIAPPVDPHQQLLDIQAADSATVASIPDGAWLPQISSKQVGLVVNGVTFGDQEILDDHQALRAAYPGVVLLWSGDFKTFVYPDFWVTLVASQVTDAPEPVLAWCAQQGLDNDHCYAKRLSATTAYEPNSKHP